MNDGLQFEGIYAAGGWDNQGSGPGSTEAFTRDFRRKFERLLEERKISSVFDLGCGDWQWQSHVEWPKEFEYVGWDVSQTAIERAEDFVAGNPKLDFFDFIFKVRDAFLEPVWPEADLLLVKDVLHHVSRFKARMLRQRATLYNHVLWVVDLDDTGCVINWPGTFNQRICLTLFHDFDLNIENYRYGRKAAFLQTNP